MDNLRISCRNGQFTSLSITLSGSIPVCGTKKSLIFQGFPLFFANLSTNFDKMGAKRRISNAKNGAKRCIIYLPIYMSYLLQEPKTE